MEFAYIVIWLLFGLVAAAIANSKGRGGCGWFILGMLLGPFSLVVAFLPSMSTVHENKARRTGESGDYKKCPFCAEAVRKDAIRCKHCGSNLPVEEEDKPVKKEIPAEKTLAYKMGTAWAKIKRKRG